MLLAAVLLHWPLDASALGLNELSVHSALNEPFYAEIPLSFADDKELKTLRARVVDRPDFDAPGFQRGLLSPVRVTLVSEDGRHILRIRSEHSVNEPFVRFLLQVDWAGGRLQREFTALIDPRAPGEAPAPPRPEASAADQARAAELDISGPPSSEPTITPADPKKTPQTTTAPDPAAAKAVPEEARGAPGRANEAADRPRPEEVVKPPEPDTTDRSQLAQRKRIESEIRAWAEEQQQDRRKATDEDERSADKPQDEAAAVSASPPVVQKAPPRAKAPTPPPLADSAVQPTLFEWVLQNQGHLLALLVLGIAAGVVLASVAVAFVLYRRRRLAVSTSDELEELEQPEPDEGITLLPEEDVDNRRRGPGRRRRFVPVAIERRQGPRRASDRVQAAARVVYPVKADTTEEAHTYMAVGRNEHAEQALKDAISRQPWRQGLKVKLLAVLYRQGNRDAFETLINQLYIALEDEAVPQRRSAGSSEGESPGQRHSGAPLSGEWAVNAAAADAETVLMGKQQPRPMGDVEPQSQTPESKAPETFEYPKKDAPRGLQEPLVKAMEALELELPHVDTDALEGDMEVLDMDVPRSEDDDPTHLMMAGTDASGQAASADKHAAADRDAEGDAGTTPLTGEDLEDIRSAVTRGIELLETPQAEGPGDDRAGSSTSGKGRPTRDKRRAKRSGKPSQQGTRMRWQDPAIRIDLAKAYIDMGDVERARRILEEVLEAWHPGDGTRRG